VTRHADKPAAGITKLRGKQPHKRSTDYAMLSRIAPLLALLLAVPAMALELHVDPVNGNDDADGSPDAPMQTIDQAVRRLSKSGGTLHLAEDAVFFERIRIVRPGGPITIEGNNATLDLSIDISDGPWIQQDSAFILDREVALNTTRAPWQMAGLYIDDHPIRYRNTRRDEPLGPGLCDITEDGRLRVHPPAGVDFSEAVIRLLGQGSAVEIGHAKAVTIRNLHVRFAGNDGFNIHGASPGILLERVSAGYCGDEGISAHTASEVTVRDAVVAFNNSKAGGVADVGESITTYERTASIHNFGVGFYLDGKSHRVSDCVVFGNRRPVDARSQDIEITGMTELETVKQPLDTHDDASTTDMMIVFFRRNAELFAESGGPQ